LPLTLKQCIIMNYTKTSLLAIAISVTALLPLLTAQEASAREWKCNATIALKNSSYSFAVPDWSMSGGITVDREKRCKNAIQSNWIDNGAIWKSLGIAASEQNKFCQSGGDFRIDYGFDKRRKDWNFSASSKPACACATGQTFN
jgi:hypothetical protein